MRSPAIYLTVLVLSTCGLAYELLAGACATYLLGDSVTQFATVIGLHLTMMGAGAWATRHIETEPGRRLIECQLAVALVGGCTAPALFLAFSRVSSFRAVLYGLVALTGVLVGAEVPLLLRLVRRRMTMSELVARVLAVDYVGALVGSLLFVLLALPHLGMVRAGLVFGVLNALCGLWGTWVFGTSVGPVEPLRSRAYAVLALLGLGLVLSQKLSTFADQEVSTDPVVFVQQTSYQRIVLTRGHGGFNLFLDGNLQFSSVDEYRYHEALVHPVLTSAPRRARVLVLGGGDGLAAREILRYPDVLAVTLVDLDPGMTRLGRDAVWLRALNAGALRSPRVRVVNDDAMVWLGREENSHALFDAAVVDFPDPNNLALGKLYTVRFYRLLREHLAPGAVVAVQATSPLAARRSYWCVVHTLEVAGYNTRPYHAMVPSFGEWGFVLAAPGEIGPAGELPAGLRYITPETFGTMGVFSPDMSRVSVEANRLNNQVLARYYDEEWHRWVR